jgi:hypothetical protein
LLGFQFQIHYLHKPVGLDSENASIEFGIMHPRDFRIPPTGVPTHYEAGMRLFIFTIRARNGLLEDNKPGSDNQIKELGQTELRDESFAASNERCPEQI